MDALSQLADWLSGSPIGGIAAHQLLGWAVRLRSQELRAQELRARRQPAGEQPTDEQRADEPTDQQRADERYVGSRLAAAVATLARTAAADSVTRERHESARALLVLALHAATGSGDADLRARVIGDIADHQLRCGYQDECLAVLRLAEGDERTGDAARSALKEVRHRAAVISHPDGTGDPDDTG